MKTRTTTGIDSVRVSVALLFAVAVGSIGISGTSPASATAGDKKAKKREAVYALIAGTVFQPSGFSLAGAELTVTPDPEAKPAGKVKKLKAVSDARGEFAVRVPPVPMRYIVSVRAKGFRGQEKPVTIGGEERVDVFFRLEPASK